MGKKGKKKYTPRVDKKTERKEKQDKKVIIDKANRNRNKKDKTIKQKRQNKMDTITVKKN